MLALMLCSLLEGSGREQASWTYVIAALAAVVFLLVGRLLFREWLASHGRSASPACTAVPSLRAWGLLRS